jgi:hypothetical protein
MSVTCVIDAASGAEITDLRTDPTGIHSFLNPPQVRKRSWPARLFEVRRAIGLGESSDAIHFILTGTKFHRRACSAC